MFIRPLTKSGLLLSECVFAMLIVFLTLLPSAENLALLLSTQRSTCRQQETLMIAREFREAIWIQALHEAGNFSLKTQTSGKCDNYKAHGDCRSSETNRSRFLLCEVQIVRLSDLQSEFHFFIRFAL